MSGCTKDRATIDSKTDGASLGQGASDVERADAPETAPTVPGASSSEVPMYSLRNHLVFMDDEVWCNGRRLREWKEDW